MPASKTYISVFATILMMILGCPVAGPAAADDLESRAEIGFRIAEQQGITLDRDNPAQGLGSYLVNASACNDCHTWPNYAPGGDPFSRQPKEVNISSFLAGGRAFVLPTETVCSRNITPAPDTHMPAGLSRADFLYVMHTGCDPKDANFRDPQACELLQVMPWPNFREMRKQELSAIYTFLSALPHAEPGAAKQCAPAPQGIAGE
jgi:hypothetical protein